MSVSQICKHSRINKLYKNDLFILKILLNIRANKRGVIVEVT